MRKELNKTKDVFVKKSKMSLAKSTTALTCLVGLFIVSSDPATATSTTTTTGSFIASASVASACTFSAGAMGFGTYNSGSDSTATSVLTVNCSTGQAYTISFNDTDNGSAQYILQNTTTGTSSTGHQLLVSFAKSTGGAMTSGAATITGTGIGAADTLATSIVGTIASGQSGKAAGSYSKTMTLNLVY
jgi:hypothetical protein